MGSKYSDCCGAEPRSNGDCDTEDFGICSDCHDHCTYIEYCDECDEPIEDCVCEKLIKEDIPPVYL